VVVIEVWDWERWHADHFLGGALHRYWMA
jgi:hypothetical protein